jgi:hypothetical protein
MAGNVVPFDARRRDDRERAKRSPVKRDIVASLRRAELVERLWKHRDEAGPPRRDEQLRRMRLLLELGLPAVEARRRAPWLGDGALEEMIDAAHANAAYWAADATHTIADKIGERIELTFDEFKACGGFRHIAPCDAQPREVREFWDERRRNRDADRKRRNREAEKKDRALRTDRLSPRAGAVLKFIDRASRESSMGESTQEIAKGVRASPAFKGVSEGALIQAVKRAVRELVAAGEVEKRTLWSRYRGSLKYRVSFVFRVQHHDEKG